MRSTGIVVDFSSTERRYHDRLRQDENDAAGGGCGLHHCVCTIASLRANDGPCCAQLAHSMVTCGDNGCKGSINYMSCAEPTGAGAQHYHVLEVKCCTASYEDYAAPTGGNGCESFSVPPSTLSMSRNPEHVWVRRCAAKAASSVRRN